LLISTETPPCCIRKTNNALIAEVITRLGEILGR